MYFETKLNDTKYQHCPSKSRYEHNYRFYFSVSAGVPFKFKCRSHLHKVGNEGGGGRSLGTLCSIRFYLVMHHQECVTLTLLELFSITCLGMCGGRGGGNLGHKYMTIFGNAPPGVCDTHLV